MELVQGLAMLVAVIVGGGDQRVTVAVPVDAPGQIQVVESNVRGVFDGPVLCTRAAYPATSCRPAPGRPLPPMPE